MRWRVRILRVFDVLAAPATLIAGLLLKALRIWGVGNMPVTRSLLRHIGVFPITDHYYEPLFHPRHLQRPLDRPRTLPGLDLNVDAQLALLERFDFTAELTRFPLDKAAPGQFHYHNGAFESGDAEILYSMVRLCRPARFIEIGSGFSTLLVRAAIERNTELDPAYRCEHIGIEPYENPWLEEVGVHVLRQRVQDVDPSLFASLERNDILFIDSSHVIRPQGDVLFEYLEVLPSLREGVIVHIHDIFSPRDYLRTWVIDEIRFWNEQYLVEALLSGGGRFSIIAALNYLAHEQPHALMSKCPVYAAEAHDREPGSLWIVRGSG